MRRILTETLNPVLDALVSEVVGWSLEWSEGIM